MVRDSPVTLLYRSPSATSGPIYSLQIFRTPVVVINSVEVARELMEAKSANYVTRPLTKMVEL